MLLETNLSWRDVSAIAQGSPLALAPAVRNRVAEARAIVEAIGAQGIRAYGINTGVGALCEAIIPPEQQRALSRNIVMSHAVGFGPSLREPEARAIMAAAINNYAHGHSGVRPVLVDTLVAMLNGGCTPDVPWKGSVGYLSHMAHIGLVLMGDGAARCGGGPRLAGREGLAQIACEPLVLDVKEGLSIVNGSPCATGLACLALGRAERLLDWADAIAALSFESLDGQISAFDPAAMDLQRSPGLRHVAGRLRALLHDSARLAASAGHRVQDALSLRAIPHVHGGARDTFEHAAEVVTWQLESVSDNPVVYGTPDAPRVCSTAHALSAGLALALDALAIAIAEVAAMAERRIDRLVNPLVSGLPAFLAPDHGVGSGFMIAQYAAVSLVGENRRLAAPASLDGGVTSGLQEDHLSHATPAALKLLDILDNATRMFSIELTAAAQASELHDPAAGRARGTEALFRRVRAVVPLYTDAHPLASDLDTIEAMVRDELCDPAG